MNGFFKTKDRDSQKITMIDVSLIVPNKSQPRTEFNDAAIKSLAESIRENGIIQPVCVRKSGALYEIISGERRTRAAKSIGMEQIPCIIMSVDDEKSAVLALIENIQRKDLSYFEEALAIEKLISVYGLTQENAALKLGKAQSTVANKLRLLRFTDTERRLLIGANLSERQARAIIRVDDADKRMTVIEKVVSRRLNLEQTEQLVNDTLSAKMPEKQVRHNKNFFKAPPRLYMNSINSLIKRMKENNIPCETSAVKGDSFYEYVIRFPINI